MLVKSPTNQSRGCVRTVTSAQAADRDFPTTVRVFEGVSRGYPSGSTMLASLMVTERSRSVLTCGQLERTARGHAQAGAEARAEGQKRDIEHRRSEGRPGAEVPNVAPASSV